MPCVDPRLAAGLLAAAALVLSGCATTGGGGGASKRPARTTTPSVAAPLPPTPGVGAGGEATLPGPRSRNWTQFKLLAAERIVAANPSLVYAGVPPAEPLAAPVLLIELHADGSLAQVKVLRYPAQARDTADIAVAAVKRAAPFGDVSHLPRPWQFTESFLFNPARKFKPLTLDR